MHIYTTRNISGNLKNYNNFTEAFMNYKNDPTVWKISWDDSNFPSGRQRWLVYKENGESKWDHEDIMTQNVIESLTEQEFYIKFT